MIVSRLRRTLHRLLRDDDVTSWLERLVGISIITSIVVAVLATEPLIREQYLPLLRQLDRVLAVLFGLEYAARLWVAPLEPGQKRGLAGAMRYARSPIALLDLAAFAPTLVGMISPELYLLRLIRLLHIGRLGRSSHFRRSLLHFHEALSSKRSQLQISAVYTAVLLLISSSAMYLAESGIQPAAFGSIPRCLWWAVITVTTVGYGDVSPITPLGKIVASFTALSGIVVIAIPIGIIAAGFSESFEKYSHRDDQPNS